MTLLPARFLASIPVKTSLASVLEFRERAELSLRRRRRPFDVAKERARLEARRRTPVFELLTSEEVARLQEVAPGLMKMK